MTAPRIKVLSINGWCRNGSTIIGNLLNEVDGFFHAGELHFLWKNAYGNGSNTKCGCGLDLVRCPIWSKVLATELPPGKAPEEHAREVRQRQSGSLRTRHTWRVLRDGLGSDVRREHARTMARTYRTIAEVTGSRVIVDSTKIPGEAALLPSVEGIDPLYLHLVRDPRAVAHSWSRQKAYVYAMPPARSAAYWVGFNLASRAIAKRHPERSMLMRYEDFIQDPAAAIRSLIELCDGDPSNNPVHGRLAELRENHTVTGNPDRFKTGTTEIRAFDSAWQAELSTYAKLTTLALSWPLLMHYGYSLRGASPVTDDDR
jgi:Sulfotransferase domain